MKWGSKPVIVIGHGVRASGVDATKLLAMGVPVLSSWQAMDVVDNYHPAYFGRPGIFGQRSANKILYEADQVVSVGCRLTPWLIGHAGLRPEQQLVMVDCDKDEVARFPNAEWLPSIEVFLESEEAQTPEWFAQCESWRTPWIESPTHDDTNGYINSYRVIAEIEKRLRPDEVICVDVGSFMCSVFQALHVKPPQRVINSGGLGEMGWSLPASVGASFARNKGEVLCLVGDGGLMLNLHELQTIVHHQLPVKIIVFENDGYAMIKGTHKNMGLAYTGVNKASGLSMPEFVGVAAGFKMNACSVRTWDSLAKRLDLLFKIDGPFLMVIHLDPEQTYLPRLQPTIVDGKIIPPKFSDLSPLRA